MEHKHDLLRYIAVFLRFNIMNQHRSRIVLVMILVAYIFEITQTRFVMAIN